jgi:FkbM family methyltransferase
MKSKLIDLISDLLSSITRSLSFIPGMYFITKPIHRVFIRYYSKHQYLAWKIISLGGYKIKLNISHRIAAVIYWRGAQEWAPMFLLKSKLKPEMIVYDIGANLGEVTLFAGHIVGEKGKVVSFEPMKETFDLLQYNIELNGYTDRVICYNIALSDQNGELNLYAAGEPDQLGSFEDGLHTLFPSNDRNLLLHKVRVEKLDDKMKDILPPDLIKIDVEGAELFVLMGAISVLKKYHPQILIEINSESFHAAGYDQRDVFDFLTGLKYKMFMVGNRGKLEPLDMSKAIRLANVYCIWVG